MLSSLRRIGPFVAVVSLLCASSALGADVSTVTDETGEALRAATEFREAFGLESSPELVARFAGGGQP